MTGALAAVCALLLAACAARVPVGEQGAAKGPGHVLTLRGRVEAAHALGDTWLSGYRVTSDGELREMPELVIGSRDENGGFAVAMPLPAERPDLIIVSHSESGQLAAVLGTAVDVDGVIPIPIFDDESTVEAQVYGRAHAAGLWSPELRVSRMRGLLTEAMAHAVLVSDDYDAGIELLARAGVAAMLAWDRMLIHRQTGVTSEKLDELRRELDVLQTLADLEMLDAKELSERRRAEATLARWLTELYRSMAIEPGQLAAAAAAAAEALHIYAMDAPAGLRTRLRRTAELLRARYTAAFVVEQARRWGASELARAELETAGEAVVRGIVVYSDEERSQPWLRLAWEPFRRAAEMQADALGPGGAAALERRIASAMDGAERRLSELHAGVPPEELANEVVEALLPVVPRAADASREEALFRSLSSVELPGRRGVP